MRILVSNDDGYFSPGIALLAERLAALGEVTVVAPERDRSGASNSLTLDRPLTVRRAANGFRYVNGTPTDCVHLALTGLLDAAARHRGLGHQLRRQHGRRHHLLRHRRGGHRGLPVRHPVDRGVAGRQGRQALRDRGAGRRATWSSAATRSPFAAPVLLNVNVPDVALGRAGRHRGDAPGTPPQGRAGGEDADAARRDRVLDRRRGRRAGRRARHRFPRRRRGPRLDDAAAGRPQPAPAAAAGRATGSQR